MRIKDGFILKTVVDTYVVVPIGENLVDFSAMISLNETGAFLWNCMSEDISVEQLTDKLCCEYNVDRDTAKEDIDEFINTLKKHDIIEK